MLSRFHATRTHHTQGTTLSGELNIPTNNFFGFGNQSIKHFQTIDLKQERCKLLLFVEIVKVVCPITFL